MAQGLSPESSRKSLIYPGNYAHMKKLWPNKNFGQTTDLATLLSEAAVANASAKSSAASQFINALTQGMPGSSSTSSTDIVNPCGFSPIPANCTGQTSPVEGVQLPASPDVLVAQADPNFDSTAPAPLPAPSSVPVSPPLNTLGPLPVSFPATETTTAELTITQPAGTTGIAGIPTWALLLGGLGAALFFMRGKSAQ